MNILAHDASTKRHLNYAKIGNVVIEDKVFIGAGSIILPGVRISKNSIIGSGSVVTKDITKNSVYSKWVERRHREKDLKISNLTVGFVMYD